MFEAMRAYCTGEVLDVGGYDFFLTAKKKGLKFSHWTTLEPSETLVQPIMDPLYSFVAGDGCDMHQFPGDRFDTVFCIQVLEHVFEPIRMTEEIGRVLKPGGHAIFLLPQTSTLHMAPYHYYNFTRYWVEKAMARSGLSILELRPLGGRWSSTASHLVYFFLQAFRYPGMHAPEFRRGPLFYMLLPFMCAWAFFSLPICLLLSLGDFSDEANNFLVITKKT